LVKMQIRSAPVADNDWEGMMATPCGNQVEMSLAAQSQSVSQAG
jgi:hypothetical protein